MRCPECQTGLVEIPIVEGPQLDVCPSRHGVWLDAAEANFFVENHQRLKSVSDGALRNGDRYGTAICPRCGNLLDSDDAANCPLLVCRSCQGWWLPRGGLSQLRDACQGGAIPIRFDESAFYERATKQARAQARRTTPVLPHASGKPRTGLWFLLLASGLALGLAATILFGSARRLWATAHWSRMPDQLLIILSLGIVGGVRLLVHGLTLTRRKYLHEHTPTSSIRSLAVGQVEIAGQAQVHGAPLRAPFSGLSCVLYAYEVKERRGLGRNQQWVTVARGLSPQPFSVRDATGSALVIPTGATVEATRHRLTRNNAWRSLTPETTATFNRLGVSTAGGWGEKTFRWSEACILAGEPVYVLGTAQMNPDSDDRSDNAARLSIGHRPDNPFIIADRPEHELLSRLRWKVAACLLGGSVLAFGGLAVILNLYVSTSR